MTRLWTTIRTTSKTICYASFFVGLHIYLLLSTTTIIVTHSFLHHQKVGYNFVSYRRVLLLHDSSSLSHNLFHLNQIHQPLITGTSFLLSPLGVQQQQKQRQQQIYERHASVTLANTRSCTILTKTNAVHDTSNKVSNSTTTGTSRSSSNSSNVLYIGNLDFYITKTVWEHRIRDALYHILIVARLANDTDDTPISPLCADDFNDLDNLPLQVIENVEFRNTTIRKRDIGKYHGGSVLITFRTLSTTTPIDQGPSQPGSWFLQQLLSLQKQEQEEQQQQEQLHSLFSWIVPLKIQYHYVPSHDSATTTPIVITDEEQIAIEERRKQRTASYIRRRLRIIDQTDTLLDQLESNIILMKSSSTESSLKTSSSSSSSSFLATTQDVTPSNDTVSPSTWWSKTIHFVQQQQHNSNHISSCSSETSTDIAVAVVNTTTTRTNTFYTPTLWAKEFNWTEAPSIIDPALGGGLSKSMIPNNNNNTIGSNRATRKRAAVEAFYSIIHTIVTVPQQKSTATSTPSRNHHITTSSTTTATPITIADLGCGSGNLALPLAWWLNHYSHNPHRVSSLQFNQKSSLPTALPTELPSPLPNNRFRVLGIDLNTISLQRLQNRSDQLLHISGPDGSTSNDSLVETIEMDLLHLLDKYTTTRTTATTRTSTITSSVSTTNMISPILQFRNCTAVVSLHACGAASDLAMVAAIQHQLPFAISPCCIGKTSTLRDHTTPYISNDNTLKSRKIPLTLPPTQRGSTPVGTIQYPRSKWFQSQVTSEQYRFLAAAADYGVRQQRNTIINNNHDDDDDEIKRVQRSRRAKRIIEMDRLQYAYEQEYDVWMMELPRIGPHYSKREILLGAKRNSAAAIQMAQLTTDIM